MKFTHTLSRRPPISCLVVAAVFWPAANWLNQNKWNLLTADIILFGLMALCSGLVIALMLNVPSRIIPAHYRQSYWVSVSTAMLLFFSWDALTSTRALVLNWFGLPPLFSNLILAVVFALVISLAWIVGRKRNMLIIALLFYGIALSIPMISLAWDIFFGRDGGKAITAAVQPVKLQRAANVYVFVVDGYARQDILAGYYGYNNEPFLKQMESRGYAVVRHALANYPMTYLSLASLLEMGYEQTPAMGRYSERTRFGRIIAGDSATVRRFRAHGYQFAQANHANVGCNRIADRCFDQSIQGLLPRTALSLIQLTPLRTFWRNSEITEGRETLRDYHKDLQSLPGDRLQFVFLHTLPPHPPYRLNSRCEVIDPAVSFNLDDLIKPEAKPKYVEMIRCVNANILATADLIATIDHDAIVVFLSDHGSSLLTEFTRPIDTWADEQIGERFANFLAIRLPRGCLRQSPPASLVNVMESVFACLEDRPPVYLADRFFIGVYEHNPDYGLIREIARPVFRQSPP